ncbi:mitochondrial-processing peptidase subunit alpha isoform X4 [Elaeis guineensis]|uniref:mitochondrial-processing peptidase subunit alpha isoform X4 n=1 Tax=Elaeis guineensis var. tenera TaxID=51953 RepID=UPI003C6D1708
MLMGGIGSFSTGGLGKGMHSHLYLRVLNEFPQIQLSSSFSNIYNHTGLFGIYATGSDFVSKAVDLAGRELLAVATPGERLLFLCFLLDYFSIGFRFCEFFDSFLFFTVDQVQLDHDKESTKSAVLMNLESWVVASKDIGWQILTHGERTHAHITCGI